MVADEKSCGACKCQLAALRYYKQCGVRIDAVLTFSGSGYRSKRFARLLRHPGHQAQAHAASEHFNNAATSA